MKKSLIILSAICLLCLLWGCSAFSSDPQNGPHFYYRSASTDGSDQQPVIQPEPVELSKPITLPQILSAYFQGPKSDALSLPFPVGTEVLEYSIQGGEVRIILSSLFYYQKPLDQAISCACLTKSLLELTEYESVTILAADRLGQDQCSFTMTLADILLHDEAYS